MAFALFIHRTGVNAYAMVNMPLFRMSQSLRTLAKTMIEASPSNMCETVYSQPAVFDNKGINKLGDGITREAGGVIDLPKS